MRRPRARIPILMLALLATSAVAQPIVTSAGPDDVDVTVYRAPNRDPDEALDLEWLEGYALISETRRISIPAGESEIRFEGVAGGILPQSAIVRGFPEGIVERNRDAYLLSPESLLDRSLGRRVHIRRIARATGEIRELDAVIRSGAEGAVVLQTQEGFEALRCTGLRETLIYDGVPAGLSARPTLSVRARSSRPVSATVTLSYLADAFDWQANYVATLSPAGDRVDLFAWLTLASGDETSFRNADTQAVAGRLNREHVERDEPEGGELELRCWPQARTSDFPLPDASIADARQRLSAGVVDSITAEDLGQFGEENLVLTATRASHEELGDVKLYRIPEPVTMAANSQKQVAFLEQSGVRVELVYRQRLYPENDGEIENSDRFLVTRNRTQEGLGVPLPAGSVQLFTDAGGRPILIGEGTIPDRAVGEDVEIKVGEATGVMSLIEGEDSGDDWEDHVLTVTNDQAAAVRYEAEFEIEEDQTFRPRARLGRRDGRPLWTVTVPANGTASLRYRLVENDD
jgi:hypothetical protein